MKKAPAAPAGAPAAAAAPGAQKGRKIKYWVDPMDPTYVRDKPGKAPCGMDLVPVYEEEGGAARRPRRHRGLPRHHPIHGGADRQGGGQAPDPRYLDGGPGDL